MGVVYRGRGQGEGGGGGLYRVKKYSLHLYSKVIHTKAEKERRGMT
jgi:hypothetical protein